jgi:DNA-binding winged helix-turn-helix (wHTH) protein/tetratricopeptide (TPR) repeat protein
MSRPTPRAFEFGPFRLDANDHLLLREGKPVPLTPKAFETLLILVRNGGRVVEKESLIRRLWPDTFVEDNNLAVNISALRKALGESENGHHYIENIPKRGYRFTASVKEIWEASQDSRAESQAPSVAGAAESIASSETVVNSLAVLPLINATDDPGVEYLSDGITESLINKLSQFPQLKVMSRSLVFRHKGRDVDPQEVGRDLGVHAVLTGRLIQLGDSLIIRTELTDVRDGVHIWGEQYNRKPSDLLAVQEEISWEISEKLRLKLSGEQKRRLTKRHTESTEAYSTYLKGRFYWNKRTLDGLKKGTEYFEQAISIDPNYALPHAGLADSYLLLGSVEYCALDPQEARRRARASALEALKLDDSLAEAHASLAYVKMFDWDWADALQEFNQAIELNPAYATARHWYALYLMAMNRQRDALREIERAREIDPLSLPINAGVAWYFFLTRQYEQSLEECSRTLEMDSNFYMAHFVRGLAYVQMSKHEQALLEYEKGSRLSGGTPLMLAAQAHAYALSKRADAAQKILTQLFQLSRERYVSPYYIAVIYTALGETDKAFEWLESACANHSEGLTWLKVDPTIDGLRVDERFNQLIHRVHLD